MHNALFNFKGISTVTLQAKQLDGAGRAFV
jgi:hypothetical protein